MASLLLIIVAAVVASVHTKPPPVSPPIHPREQNLAMEPAGCGLKEDLYWCVDLEIKYCYLLMKWCPNRCKTDAFVPTCGKVNRAKKIVGGVETEVHEYPWQVGFTASWWYNHTKPTCGGSIINERWILTAAHCAEGMSTSTDMVVVGEHAWSTESDTSATQSHAIEEILMHPNYNDSIGNGALDNDIALIKLAEPLTFNPDNKVAPVCPPSPREQYENVDAIVTGWGALWQGGSSPDSLQEVVIPTMTNLMCQSAYEGNEPITDNMICAAFPDGGKDSCQGDSGGPMITADGSIYRQIGVVSWGEGCAMPEYPGVYARITNKLEWIENSISGTSWSQPEDSSTTTSTPEVAGCQCGRVGETTQTRVVNGAETDVLEYPWQAGLVWYGASRTWCGGSLINSKWVMSAAHCTVGKTRYTIQVLLGEHTIYTTDGTEKRCNVSQVINHPNFYGVVYGNDVSLLELSDEVDFSSTQIRPICLPSTQDIFVGAQATVAGWGRTGAGDPLAEVLLDVDIPVVTNTVCNSAYYNYNIDDTMICAGTGDGTGAFKGDSGGPLITSLGDYHIQIGVVSWGSKYADSYGVYARVTALQSWVESYAMAGNAKMCQP